MAQACAASRRALAQTSRISSADLDEILDGRKRLFWDQLAVAEVRYASVGPALDDGASPRSGNLRKLSQVPDVRIVQVEALCRSRRRTRRFRGDIALRHGRRLTQRSSNWLGRWSAEDLAGKARLGVATMRRAEAQEGAITATQANAQAIRETFEKAGLEFILENGEGPVSGFGIGAIG